MENIFKNYNILVDQFNKNKKLVEEYFYYIMAVSLFMNENRIIINNHVYDHLFTMLVREINNGTLGPLSDYEYYYGNLNIPIIKTIIIKYLRDLKDNMTNPTDLGCAISKCKILTSINRKGWINRNVPEYFYESDALHTMQMFALISMLYASGLINIKEPKKIYEMIFIHEIGEIVSGDITELDPRHKIKFAWEEAGAKEAFGEIDCGEYFMNLWYEFESKETAVARLAYEIDKLDAILKANYLTHELNRKSLVKDFFEYEERRDTFIKSEVKPLFEIVRTINFK